MKFILSVVVFKTAKPPFGQKKISISLANTGLPLRKDELFLHYLVKCLLYSYARAKWRTVIRPLSSMVTDAKRFEIRIVSMLSHFQLEELEGRASAAKNLTSVAVSE